MPVDFPKKTIDVRYATENYGPYNFDFEDALPGGINLVNVNIRSFLGIITENSDLSAETESTTELVDSALSVINGNHTVDLFLNYPSTAAYIGQNHTLVFEVTTSAAGNTATHAFYFHRVKVHG